MRAINVNADCGESFGPWVMGGDEALLPLVASANVACGGHAGDPLVMTRTVRLARSLGVEVGAHPGYPDLQGFGRRPIPMSAEEIRAMLLAQIGALEAIARAEGVKLAYVKPHGALNNQACIDCAVAEAVVEAVVAWDPSSILLAPVASQLAQVGEERGLRVAYEVFVNRRYAADGTLVPRSQPEAVLHDPIECVAQVARFFAAGGIVTADGTVLRMPFHSLCVHGDSPEAIATARALRAWLQAQGVAVVPLAHLLAG